MTDQERSSIEWCKRIAEEYVVQAEDRENGGTFDELTYAVPPMTEIAAILADAETV